MTTTITPTFESVAKSARFLEPVRRSLHAPLPCEKEAEMYNADIGSFLNKFPVLDMSFMETTYRDELLQADLPIFAAIDLESGIVSSSTTNPRFWDTFREYSSDEVKILLKENETLMKINPALKSRFRDGANTPTSSSGLPGLKPLTLTPVLDISPAVIFGFVVPACGAFGALLGGVPLGAATGFALSGLFCSGVFTIPKEFAFAKPTLSVYHYRFDGSVPDDIRAIYQEQKENFDSIHLICDAKNRWQVEERPLPPPNPDPLMIGVKKLRSGKLLVFLLAKFDLTPSERYIVDEFAI